MDTDETQIKIGAWTWTKWPTAPLPSLEWIVQNGQDTRKGPAWVDEFHRQREEFIAREKLDPLTYGWEQPPVRIVRELLAGTYIPGQFGRMKNEQLRMKLTASGPPLASDGSPAESSPSSRPSPPGEGESSAEAGARSISVAPPGWKQERTANDVLMLGGNGSAKTDVQAKLAMEVLVSKPHREVRMFSQNEQTSQRYIQKAIARYLPPHLRHVKRRGQTTKISYAEATGFSENIFVMENHSTGLFPTYKGWEQDKKSVEGGECHALTGDEEMPGELAETARFRAHKTGGFMLLGFTPVGGYTETVMQYVEGGLILECIPARDVVWDWWSRSWSWGEWLLPRDQVLVRGCIPGHVPLVVQSGQGKGRRFAVLLPTMFNPYTNVPEITSSVMDAPVAKKLERLWGWATNLVKKAFPTFGAVHEVDPERMPSPSELTIILWIDPHGGRNWFMAWLGVDSEGRVWVLKEWPSVDIGEWAMPGKNDGKEGPGQTAGSGRSFNDYKRIVLEQEGYVLEGGRWVPGPDAWTVSDRRLDPRPAGTSVPSDEEAKTYLDFINEPMVNPDGSVEWEGFDFLAGPACGIEEGKQLVNNWLSGGWDAGASLTPLNCPSFYVNKECENIRWALKTYTGADGEKGACKDPIDCLKGPAKLGIRHIAAGTLGASGPGGGY